jgi:hypothetical protein
MAYPIGSRGGPFRLLGQDRWGRPGTGRGSARPGAPSPGSAPTAARASWSSRARRYATTREPYPPAHTPGAWRRWSVWRGRHPQRVPRDAERARVPGPRTPGVLPGDPRQGPGHLPADNGGAFNVVALPDQVNRDLHPPCCPQSATTEHAPPRLDSSPRQARRVGVATGWEHETRCAYQALSAKEESWQSALSTSPWS